MRRRQMMQKVSRISLGVVVGLLFLALIWKFAGAQLAKKGIVLSNDTEAKTVSEMAPEAEDGSGNAGIKKLAETTPPNETPGWQYSSSGWWYATDATTYYVNGWADIDGNQYHFDSNGYMATGWKAIGSWISCIRIMAPSCALFITFWTVESAFWVSQSKVSTDHRISGLAAIPATVSLNEP